MLAVGVLGPILDKTCPRRLYPVLSNVEVSCGYPDPEYASRPTAVQGLHHREANAHNLFEIHNLFE
jgi:hypothetical protein